MSQDTLAVGPDGRLTRNGTTYAIVFERRLKQPIEKVWAAITEPARIADWFTTMSFEPNLRLGATVTIAFGPDDVVYGEVTALEPPRVFAYREPQPGGGNNIVRFELVPDGAGTRLVFSQTGLCGKSRDGMADNAAGWHGMLNALVDLVAGGKVNHDEGDFPLSPRYRAALDQIWGSDDPDGAIRRRADGGYEIVFRRRIRKPLEKVWAALTVPERLADWLAAASIEPDLRVGARFTLRFAANDYRMAGEIVELDPPRLIAWTWPDPDAAASAQPGVVRFELAPDGDGCVLTLTDGGPGKIHPNQAAGWHTHLEGLPGAADGAFNAWDREVEAVHEARYREVIARL
jgi:uncharacterized protein YndB with AHSA1/START domain